MNSCQRAFCGLILALPSAARSASDEALVQGAIFSAVTLATDYRYEGVSESSGKPALQAYLHWYRPDGFYAGVFATRVDFDYRGSPTYEIDSYAGHNVYFDSGKVELKTEGMYSAYPDNRTPGPTFNFFQTKVQIKYTSGRWTAIGLIAYTPEGSYASGPLLREEAELDVAAGRNLVFKTLVGHTGEGIGHERTYWSFGAAKTWKALTFEVRLVGADRTRGTCGFQPKACDTALVGAITFAVPPLKLKP